MSTASKAAQAKYRRTPKYQETHKAWWKAKGRERYASIYRFNRMLKQYGLTREQYEKILRNQEGKCCLPSCSNLAECIDHCHTSNKVRSLLCRPCNLALGNFRENPQLMREGASYIEGHRVI